MNPEFLKFPKIPRLRRGCFITEKIDGTNGCVVVSPDGDQVWAQSRNRFVTPEDDNAGFARWVYDNAGALSDTLGPGHHFGEWWGKGIQRGYGADRKYFSLFNTGRWDTPTVEQVDGLTVVPVLYQGPFTDQAVDEQLDRLRRWGSFAYNDYMDPEGIVVFMTSSHQSYKVLLKNDELPKGLVENG